MSNSIGSPIPSFRVDTVRRLSSKMDAANFAADFTHLLIRYTTPKTPIEKAEQTDGSSIPLNPAVIVELVQESLRAVLSAVNLPNIAENVYKTPINDIVINTPDAPNVTRQSHNGIENGNDREQYISTISEKMETSVKEKDTSPSNVHLSAIGRSDTFVQENGNSVSKNIEKNLGNCEIQVKINNNNFETSEETSNGMLQTKLAALRKCAVDVIAKIDDVKAVSAVVPSKPIRRLSAVGTYTCTERNSSMMRSIQPSKVRRSLTVFPGTTPTSSRLNGIATVGEILSKRKSTSSVSLHIPNTSTISSKSSLAETTLRSNTSLSLPITKKSPCSDGKPPKNPKYAHIQSSIPKPSFVPKRKP